jgi:hypothetical protein
MKMTVLVLMKLSAVALAMILCAGRAAGQGTENLPLTTTYKDYRLETLPPINPEPVSPPTDDPLSGLPRLTISVPEPGTTFLLLAGAGLLAGVSWRRRTR